MRMLLLALVMIAAVIPLTAAMDTKNLLHNGDFEESDMPPRWWSLDATPGASLSLVPRALTGKQAALFSLPAAGTVTLTSQPCDVTANEDYLFTFWYRADGMNVKGMVRFYAYLSWKDAEGKDLGTTLYEMPYGPAPDYRVASYTVPAPAGTVRAGVKFSASVGTDYKGEACAFYLDQVRLMRLPAPAVPPDASHWDYLGRTPSDSLKMVNDKDAAQGEAVLAQVGASGCMTFGPYSTDQPVGDYLCRFRLKVKDNTIDKPVASLDVTAPGCLGYVLACKTLKATDFKEPGVYQDFTLRFFRPEEGMLEFRVNYAGGADLWYDSKTVVQMAAYPTDKEQAAIWLGGDTGVLADAAPPAGPQNNVLVLAGPDNRILFSSEALNLMLQLKCTYAYLANVQTGYTLDQPLPKTLDKLNGIGLIVLVDIPATALNGLMGRRTLRQFVERGGGLLIFGGPLSLGKGDFAGSALEPALPITTTGAWDLVKAAVPVVKVAKDSPLTRGLRWNQQPLVYYYQRTTPRPGAETLLTCDGAPILVTGKFGKGRVAVFAATNLGDPAAGQTPFYQWPDYLLLLSRVTQWLIKGTL